MGRDYSTGFTARSSDTARPRRTSDGAFAALGTRVRSAEADAAIDKLNASIAALITTVPTTPAGLDDWLAYIDEGVEPEELVDHMGEFLDTLRAAVRALTARP